MVVLPLTLVPVFPGLSASWTSFFATFFGWLKGVGSDTQSLSAPLDTKLAIHRRLLSSGPV